MRPLPRALPLLIATLVVGAAPAAAGAAPRPAPIAADAAAGVTYGGATYGPVRGNVAMLWSVGLLRQPDGRLSARVAFAFHCPEQHGVNVAVKLAGRLGADGRRFVLRRTARLPGGRVRLVMRGRLTPDAASGVLRPRFTGYGRCPYRARKFVLRPLGLPGVEATPAAAPPESTILGGTTEQSVGGMPLPVAVRVGKGQRTVTGLWQVRVRCPRTTGSAVNFSPAAMIHRDGTFERRERFTLGFTDGRKETYRVTFNGRFVAGGAIGTLRMRVTGRGAHQRRVTCDSGVQHWTARS